MFHMTLCVKCEREAAAMTLQGPLCIEHEMENHEKTQEEGRYTDFVNG